MKPFKKDKCSIMIRTDFADFPVLETERILLRPLRMEDELPVFRLRSDEGVNKWLGRKKAESIAEARDFIEMIVRLTSAGESMYWALEMKENRQFAGTVTIWNLDKSAAKAEIGYELLPEFQGRGIMHEVLKAVIDFGFVEMNLKRIEACLSPNNERSIHLLSKLGFNFEGKLAGEEEADLVVYALINS